MAKLKSKLSEAAAPKSAAKAIKDSAQQIWLAGLGAFSKAQDEGAKLFETLVREGSDLEKKTRKMTAGKVDEMRGVVETTVGQVRERAQDTWDKLEKVFEDRVQRALNRLGVPGRDELRELGARIEELSKAVASQGKGASSAKPAAEKAAKAPARKAAAKPAAAKAPAAKPAPAKPRKPAARKTKAAEPGSDSKAS